MIQSSGPIYDVLFSLAVFVPALAAFVVWWRREKGAPVRGVLWFAIILLVPLFGPLAYLGTALVSASRQRSRPNAQAAH